MKRFDIVWKPRPDSTVQFCWDAIEAINEADAREFFERHSHGTAIIVKVQERKTLYPR